MSNLTMPLLSVATHGTASAMAVQDIHGNPTVDTELHCLLGSRARRELTTDPPEDGSATIFKAETLRAQGIKPKHEIRNSKQIQMTKISSFKQIRFRLEVLNFLQFGVFGL